MGTAAPLTRKQEAGPSVGTHCDASPVSLTAEYFLFKTRSERQWPLFFKIPKPRLSARHWSRSLQVL